MADPRPLLVYDGDCAFCLDWVRRWQSATGDRVRYAPYQQVADAHPQIPRDQFARAVQLIAPDGRVTSGAAASLQTLALAPGHGAGWWLYRCVPGVATVCEAAYGAIARHRGAAFRVSRLLWGAGPTLSRHVLSTRLSSSRRWRSSTSRRSRRSADRSRGSPARTASCRWATTCGRRPGGFRLPGGTGCSRRCFWLDASDGTLQAACAAGVAASALLLFGRARRTMLAVLFVAYLSLFYAGQVFMDFQWDLLLLEADFLALVLCRRPELLAWAVRWLVFRFMLMSGLVKFGGDPAWRDFSALRRHFWTQPLPSPLAWSVARWPSPLLAAGAAATLLVELVVPFALLLPRRPRQWAAVATIVFQAGIMATGNYGFFNLLVVALCIPLFDDAAVGRWTRWWPGRQRAPAERAAPQGWRAAPAWAFAVASVLLGLCQTAATAFGDATPAALDAVTDLPLPLHVVNRYGPFRSMTADRPEIRVEGTLDSVHWTPYVFAHKPGDVRRPPHWNIPAQPRLDWQLWFAALGTQQDQPWFRQFVRSLLRRDPPVIALLDHDPFAGRAPIAVRALLDDYRPADPQTHAEGAWWTRQPSGIYLPPVRLDADGRLAPADAP